MRRSGMGHLALNDSDGTGRGNETFWTHHHDAVVATYPPSAFTLMGVYVSVVGFLGVVANGTVLVIFSR